MRCAVGAVAAAAVLVACSGQSLPAATDVAATPSPATSSPLTTPAQSPTASPAVSPSSGPGRSSDPTSPARTPGPSPAPTTRQPPAPATSPASAGPGAYAGKIVSKLPVATKVVALTFDGGADARGAQRIVDILRSQGVPASFFVTGTFAKANPALIRTLAAIGPVGNHSWDHPHFPALSDGLVRSQLSRTRDQIAASGGGESRPLFRFPFGESSPHTLALVNAEGYLAVGWTVDSLGWQGTSGGQSVTKVVDRVVAARSPGEIVLMHLGGHPSDNSTLDADALPTIITRLRAAGYSFVTLDQLR